MIEAVVFDLGGTLIDYTGGYTQWPEMETPGFTAVYIGDDPASDVIERFHTPNGVAPDAKIANLTELMPILYSWGIE